MFVPSIPCRPWCSSFPAEWRLGRPIGLRRRLRRRRRVVEVARDRIERDRVVRLRLGRPDEARDDRGAEHGGDDDADVTASARLLPVVLTLRWRGESGVHQMRHGFYLMGY